MNHSALYNRAHDDELRLARPHERDLRWAKDRRRQHDSELGEARLLLATSPFALVRRTLVTATVLLLLVAGSYAVASTLVVLTQWMPLVLVGAVALAVVVLIATLLSLLSVRRRRAAALQLVRIDEAKLFHTQYHLA